MNVDLTSIFTDLYALHMKNILLTLMTMITLPGVAQNNLPYLGQTPPGVLSQRFPPDSLLSTAEWMWHGAPVFSQHGLEMFWAQYAVPSPGNYTLQLFTMKVEGDNWSYVRRPSFADTAFRENNPLYTSGNDSLYYYSDRETSFIRMVTRSDTAWSISQAIAVPIPSGYHYENTFSVNNKLDIFLNLKDLASNQDDLFVSRFQDGSYQVPEALGSQINSAYNEYCPFIDPDENFLIFASDRPGGYNGNMDLYISFKDSENSWGEAVNMGSDINQSTAMFPAVTLDGKYLFFISGRTGDIGYNPYWIDADIIDSLHVLVAIPDHRNPSGEGIRNRVWPNPADDTVRISFEMSGPGVITIELYSLEGTRFLVPVKDKAYPGGTHQVDLSTSGWSAGTYLFKISDNEGFSSSGKITISR